MQASRNYLDSLAFFFADEARWDQRDVYSYSVMVPNDTLIVETQQSLFNMISTRTTTYSVSFVFYLSYFVQTECTRETS